ncbi:hypothetical protein NB688_000586 [Xanthomonas sacchari]|uniref:Uncharacterized protein n=1 Tax=Xanthomonas sacchari TaxID=56458 RepID=A0ABT3DTE0_9XANT|nr:hypothetical protein [Xanthomonas sacchari]MCW0398772.1 hypothetical protein [Xanthomonas sacchari]MCW0418420.1 hypothetical protein [Xanthomonas sacchari]UYK72517.1 hypothetical protein NG828_20410 [Xanthomonas sacchari]
MENYAYLGSGKIKIREYAAAAPLVDVGNCSALTISPQTNDITLADHTVPGGGNYASVNRVTGVNIAYTFHDFIGENFARALRGRVTNVPAGTAIDEDVVAYKGGYVTLQKIPSAITKVTNQAGTTTYDQGEDYDLVDNMLYIPAGSAVPVPVSGAANLKVTYAFAAQEVTEALVDPSKNYELVFAGLNEARSGKAVEIICHKVSGGMLNELAAIADEFGGGEVTGALQSDGGKTGVGVSKYFKVRIVK